MWFVQVRHCCWHEYVLVGCMCSIKCPLTHPKEKTKKIIKHKNKKNEKMWKWKKQCGHEVEAWARHMLEAWEVQFLLENQWKPPTQKKKKLMWKWSDVKLLNLVAVRLFLGPPKSPRRRMFCKQMVDFVTVRYICSHMFLWQCFVILIIRIRLVNSYLFCFSSFSKFRFWIQYQSVTLSETSAEVWNTWAATQAHSA